MKVDIFEKYYSFKCVRCGYCCCEAGYVVFTEQETHEAADFLNISKKELLYTYGLKENEYGQYYLTVKRNSCCSFLQNNLCIIQDAKPIQCASFPYWDEYTDENGNILRSKFKRKCPGVK